MRQDRFDKFSEGARRVLSLAQEEAKRFNHSYIGTEHLFLGLLRETEGTAAEVLAMLGVKLDEARGAVELIVGRGDRPGPGEIGLTPRAKRTVELAVDEARRLGHHYIGTEHLPLGLVREGEGIAAGMLARMGVDLERVRDATARMLARRESISFRWPAPGTLRRVIPIAQSQERERITITLLSVEDYVEAFLVLLRITAAPETATSTHAPPAFPTFSALDDLGRRYESVARDQLATGVPGDWRVVVPCATGLDPAARELRLELGAVGPAAPWTFTVPLSG